MNKRWVATYLVRDGRCRQSECLMCGRRKEYAVVFGATREQALSHAKALQLAQDAVEIEVAEETSSHCIPRLDPDHWNKLNAAIAEMNRRIRG